MKVHAIKALFAGTLRRRLVISVAVVQAVLMTFFIADLTVKQQAVLRGQHTSNAMALANVLATSSAGWLVARDISGLQELVEGQRHYPQLEFSMILDQHGLVLAHTDRSHLSQTVVDLPHDKQKMFLTQNVDLVDVCVPVMLSGKEIGWARVGISQKGVANELSRIVWAAATYAGLAIFIGSLMAWIFGALFTRRLDVIQGVMESVKAGNQEARVILSGADEAAELAAGFNQMLETLHQRTREVTELNATLEQHVAERTYQLECTNKELEAFSYSVSHDLRAPLRAIDGFSTFLEEEYGGKLDEEGRRLLGVIRANTRKMERLITDLLTLSRTTQSDLNLTQIDMRALVEAVFQETGTEEIRQQFKFITEPMPSAWGDPVLLRQVWANLISNAIKYTAKSPVKEIEIGGYIKNEDRVYFIKDSGVGFNPNYAGKLFGAFQRLHKAEDFEGTGIGLAIVQRIIRRHEGRVWAEGKENSGATFSFSLPNRKLGV